MKLVATIIFLLSFFLETSITTLPLVFLTLLCLAVLTRKEWIFIIAFIAGLALDVSSFRALGQSSLYFVLFIFLVFLYERKFEISTKYFILIASFLGSFGFLIIFSYNNLVLQSVFSSIIGVLIFAIFSRFHKDVEKNIKF
jgi:rod shape-determining protein MreD